MLWHKIQVEKLDVSKARIRESDVTTKVWKRPSRDIQKCNIHASWRNGSLMSGGDLIVRNYTGEISFHARDAFTPVENRFTAELNCI
ncbi:unnamed protein product [Cochlearia groenlandica]